MNGVASVLRVKGAGEVSRGRERKGDNKGPRGAGFYMWEVFSIFITALSTSPVRLSSGTICGIWRRESTRGPCPPRHDCKTGGAIGPRVLNETEISVWDTGNCALSHRKEKSC